MTISRILAVLHVALALTAFGIGNTVIGGGLNAPALLHFVLGSSLFVTAVSLWRKGQGLRWAVALNLTLAIAVAAIFVLDRLEGNPATSTGLVAAAIAFTALQVFTLMYTPSST